MKLKKTVFAFLFITGICFASQPANMPRSGHWRAWLVITSQQPDGKHRELPFDLELMAEREKLSAWVVNGSERISIPEVRFVDGELILSIDYYDSTIRAKLSDDGKRLDGEWQKQSSGDSVTKMPFHAKHGYSPRFPRKTNSLTIPSTNKINGRWLVQFEKSDDPAVGLFQSSADGATTGTFMTTTGDYRYLAGDFDGEQLRLSCFDGAHAFLFDAKMLSDGTLAGDFWSRDRWHETWTAHRDDNAKLPDAFGQTTWDENVSLGDISFPDVDGHIVTLNQLWDGAGNTKLTESIERHQDRKAGQLHSILEKSFAGQARILVVFGTWCPNCHDASNYLVELHKRYHKLGLSIVGLAFELTGNLKRDARQVKKYVEKHGIQYPVLIAGVADKKKASEALPFLDKLRSYPTTIFLDSHSKVRAVHTGFTGPATGQAYRDLRNKFESLIETLLSE